MIAFALIIPILFLGAFAYAAVKRVNVYDSFVSGVKKAPPLLLSVFPYMVCIFIMTELFEKSGLSDLIINFVSPAFGFLGIPKGIVKLVLIKPFSGSGATALLTDILSVYGADSFEARCACVCYGSSETVFYIAAVYFAEIKKKRLFTPIAISLTASFLATILACLLCRIM